MQSNKRGQMQWWIALCDWTSYVTGSQSDWATRTATVCGTSPKNFRWLFFSLYWNLFFELNSNKTVRRPMMLCLSRKLQQSFFQPARKINRAYTVWGKDFLGLKTRATLNVCPSLPHRKYTPVQYLDGGGVCINSELNFQSSFDFPGSLFWDCSAWGETEWHWCVCLVASQIESVSIFFISSISSHINSF